MSGEKQIHDPRDPDLAAYALGALEPAEAEALARHLEGCERCAEDLVAFRRTVDRLAMSVPQHPAPPELRRRVMAAVRPQPRFRARWTPPRIGLHIRATAAAITAAVAVGVATAAIAIAILLSGGSGQARVLRAQVSDTSGSAEVRLADGRAELVVSHFAPPPSGLIYEVWLKRGNRVPTPTRVLFSVNAQGEADVGVPAQLGGVSEILVTPEPVGGSRVPTHPAVIVARMT